MNTLPDHIENEIWNMYYKDIYKENIINEMQKYIYMHDTISKKICSIKKCIFSENYLEVTKHSIILINKEIEDMLNNKTIILIYRENILFNYLFQILKFPNAYNSLPIDCRLAGAYLYKDSNFNPKMLKRLAVICSQENVVFCNFYKNMCKSIKN
tara:strand:+ start:318 stop:782 length:465 start_codon:yes stop_codon:yes gene_type:complete